MSSTSLSPLTTPVQHFVVIKEEKHGPYAFSQLQSMWERGILTLDTPHWMTGYDTWYPLSRMEAELAQRSGGTGVILPPALPVAQPPAQAPLQHHHFHHHVHAQPQQMVMMVSSKSRVAYVLLGLFVFGLFGVHNFYIGRNVAGVVQLVLTVLTFATIIGPVLVAFWVLIELICVTRDGQGLRLS